SQGLFATVRAIYAAQCGRICNVLAVVNGETNEVRLPREDSATDAVITLAVIFKPGHALAKASPG
ncbi:MAG TPA: hypothetical protein VE439_04185, partial [Anaerolineae bacterium]|nr:hypothetical protein [Anaerolineae bacterium]